MCVCVCVWGGGSLYVSSLAQNVFRHSKKRRKKRTHHRQNCNIHIKAVGNAQVQSNLCIPHLYASTVVGNSHSVPRNNRCREDSHHSVHRNNRREQLTKDASSSSSNVALRPQRSLGTRSPGRQPRLSHSS